MTTMHPWQFTREQWNAERDRLRPEIAQSRFTHASASEALARHDRLNWLLFDVHADVGARLKAAARGELAMSPEEARECLETLAQPVTYDDVIARARSLGLLQEVA